MFIGEFIRVCENEEEGLLNLLQCPLDAALVIILRGKPAIFRVRNIMIRTKVERNRVLIILSP